MFECPFLVTDGCFYVGGSVAAHRGAAFSSVTYFRQANILLLFITKAALQEDPTGVYNKQVSSYKIGILYS